MQIEHLCLSVLNGTTGQYIHPDGELALTDVLRAYTEQRVMKLVQDPAKEPARYRPESAMPAHLASFRQGRLAFLDLSQALSGKLADAMAYMDTAMDMDVLWLLFREFAGDAEVLYLGILCLAHKTVLTHRLNPDGAMELIQMAAGLPGVTQPLWAYAVLPVSGDTLWCRTKKVPIDGESVDLLQEELLGVDTTISEKAALQALLREVGRQAERMGRSALAATHRLKSCMLNAAQKQAPLDLTTWAASIWDQETARAEYVAAVKKQGVPDKLTIAPELLQKAGETLTLKTDTGIKLTIPTEYFGESVRFKPGKRDTLILDDVGEMTCK